MSSVGETLRRERRRRNLELDEISHELRISPRFLEAIEEERFDRLPAGVFAKSFVRQYARYLELDEEELTGEVQRVLEPPVPPADARPPRVAPMDIHLPRVERWDTIGDLRSSQWSWLPSLALVVLVMIVCSGVYAFWQRARRPMTAQTAAPTVTARPSAAPTPQPQTAPPQPQAEAAPSASKPLPSTAPAPAVQATNPAPSHIQSADRPTPEALAAPLPSSSAAVRLQLTAEEPVWVMARGDGKNLFTGTLQANQTQSVEANGTLLLRLGNAGGVNLTLNGKPLGAVGPKGQIRELQFTSGGFQIVPAGKSLLIPDEPI